MTSLKKTIMTPLTERKLLVDSNDKSLSVAKQCELLQINRTGLYYTPSPESNERRSPHECI
jgi:putative transposase